MNHYDYLEENFEKFLTILGYPTLFQENAGVIVSHGDKCYGYRGAWEEAGIPFHHGVALYLLTYLRPWSEEVRDIFNPFCMPAKDWVVREYEVFRSAFEDIEK